MTLLVGYLGEPASTAAQEENFMACALALRKTEATLIQDAAMSLRLVVDPEEIELARIIGIDRWFSVFSDSQ